MSRWLIALVCCQLTACATSLVPITAAEGRQSDDQLLGRWLSTLEDETEKISIVKRDGELIVIGENAEGPTLGSEQTRVIVAKIDGQRYASFTDIEAASNEYPRKYMLARYRFVDADHVVVYGPNIDLLMAAVNRQQIAGTELKDRHMAGVELSATAEQLRDYVSAEGVRIFSLKLFQLERLK
ncbi:MAG TPA: hypothetical protein VIV63_01730 [Steroidobacteraceae bacterium]